MLSYGFARDMKRPHLSKKIIIRYIRDHGHKFFLGLVLCGCVLPACFYAVYIRQNVIPDEHYHTFLSQEYSKTWGIPANSSDTYWLGDITTKPPVYHWIMGRFVQANFTGVDDYLVLRMVNVAFSVGTLLVTYAIGRVVFTSKWLQILPVFVLSQIPMFVFLSSGVNYDNLLNLFAAFSVLFFLKVLKDQSLINFGLMLVFLFAGCLTKVTMLPLLVGMGVVLAIDIVMRRSLYLQSVRSFRLRERSIVIIIVVVATLGVGAVLLYGRNILTYHAILPECDKVISESNCMSSAIYARSLEMRKSIDRSALLNPVSYLYPWAKTMVPLVFGLIGHQVLGRSLHDIIPFCVVFLASGVLFVQVWKKVPVVVWAAVTISLLYVLVLVYYQNYSTYLRTGDLYVAVQGRYVFPVLVPLITIVIWGLSQATDLKIRRLIISLSMLIFLWGNLGVLYLLVAMPGYRAAFLAI